MTLNITTHPKGIKDEVVIYKVSVCRHCGSLPPFTPLWCDGKDYYCIECAGSRGFYLTGSQRLCVDELVERRRSQS